MGSEKVEDVFHRSSEDHPVAALDDGIGLPGVFPTLSNL
jgi:hypothetical protein